MVDDSEDPQTHPDFMNMFSPSRIPALGAAILLFAGCDRETDASAQDGPEIRDMRGIVREVQKDDDTLVIEHEDVPGFMPAMTMPFTVADPAEMKDVEVGDALAFEFVVKEKESRIRELRPVDADSLQLPEPKERPETETAHVEEGDEMPSFELVDQKGREIDRDTFAGKRTVVTFIFTRCAVPDFCPLMTSNFAEVESALTERPGLAEGTRLLSISIDPEHDTPEVLQEYASNHTDDHDFWRFATGDPAEVAKLTGAFRVHTETAAGTLNHSLCTALIGPDGVIREIWRGNFWKPENVVSSLESSAARTSS